MSEYYVIPTTKDGFPRIKEDAIKEAERLARLNPDSVYVVCKVVGKVQTVKQVVYTEVEPQDD